MGEEAGWATEPVWTIWISENSTPYQDSNSDPSYPVRSHSPYRLSYPVPKYSFVLAVYKCEITVLQAYAVRDNRGFKIAHVMICSHTWVCILLSTVQFGLCLDSGFGCIVLLVEPSPSWKANSSSVEWRQEPATGLWPEPDESAQNHRAYGLCPSSGILNN
jgi:hypothetical protein